MEITHDMLRELDVLFQASGTDGEEEPLATPFFNCVWLIDKAEQS